MRNCERNSLHITMLTFDSRFLYVSIYTEKPWIQKVHQIGYCCSGWLYSDRWSWNAYQYIIFDVALEDGVALNIFWRFIKYITKTLRPMNEMVVTFLFHRSIYIFDFILFLCQIIFLVCIQTASMMQGSATTTSALMFSGLPTSSVYLLDPTSTT